jgi:hypothetical protein
MKFVVRLSALLFRIRDPPCSNLVPCTRYTEWSFSWLPSFPLTEYLNTDYNCFVPSVSNSYHRTTRHSELTNSMAPEPEGSSPHSQQPPNGPYPEPGESTPHRHPTNSPKVHSDPILPSTPWPFKWYLSFGLSHQNPAHVSPIFHAYHMPRPPHSPWSDLLNNCDIQKVSLNKQVAEPVHSSNSNTRAVFTCVLTGVHLPNPFLGLHLHVVYTNKWLFKCNKRKMEVVGLLCFSWLRQLL